MITSIKISTLTLSVLAALGHLSQRERQEERFYGFAHCFHNVSCCTAFPHQSRPQGEPASPEGSSCSVSAGLRKNTAPAFLGGGCYDWDYYTIAAVMMAIL